MANNMRRNFSKNESQVIDRYFGLLKFVKIEVFLNAENRKNSNDKFEQSEQGAVFGFGSILRFCFPKTAYFRKIDEISREKR